MNGARLTYGASTDLHDPRQHNGSILFADSLFGFIKVLRFRGAEDNLSHDVRGIGFQTVI